MIEGTMQYQGKALHPPGSAEESSWTWNMNRNKSGEKTQLQCSRLREAPVSLRNTCPLECLSEIPQQGPIPNQLNQDLWGEGRVHTLHFPHIASREFITRNSVTYHGAKPFKTTVLTDPFSFIGFWTQQRTENECPKFARRSFARPRPSAPRKKSHSEYPEVKAFNCGRLLITLVDLCRVHRNRTLSNQRLYRRLLRAAEILFSVIECYLSFSFSCCLRKTSGWAMPLVWSVIAPVCGYRQWLTIDVEAKGKVGKPWGSSAGIGREISFPCVGSNFYCKIVFLSRAEAFLWESWAPGFWMWHPIVVTHFLCFTAPRPILLSTFQVGISTSM